MGQPSYLDDIEKYAGLKQDLKALVKKWRGEADTSTATIDGVVWCGAVGKCADELEQLYKED